jgi:hypothetical protein
MGTMEPVLVDIDLVAQASSLRQRAASLRAQADQLDSLVGPTYRRRASELELEAWVLEIQSGLPYDSITSAA